MTTEMELVVGCDGDVRCIYDEALDLHVIGKLQITRASHAEPDAKRCWWADMVPADGPVPEPFKSRTDALGAAGRDHDATTMLSCVGPGGYASRTPVMLPVLHRE